MSPACELIGALPLADERGALLLGVACGASLQGACSLVLNGCGRRLRIDLTARDTSAIVAVLAGESSPAPSLSCSRPTVSAFREGSQLVLLVAGSGEVFRLLVRGLDLTRSFHNALRRHVTQPAVSGVLL